MMAENAPVASTMRPTSNSPDKTRGAMTILGNSAISSVWVYWKKFKPNCQRISLV